jgi:hypothetical protein
MIEFEKKKKKTSSNELDLQLENLHDQMVLFLRFSKKQLLAFQTFFRSFFYDRG